jgi:hypothetical protein
VDVSPDKELYVKIVSLNSWGMSVSAAGTVRAMLFTPETLLRRHSDQIIRQCIHCGRVADQRKQPVADRHAKRPG